MSSFFSGALSNPLPTGDSWTRADPVAAGAGAQFLSLDDMVLQTSSGVATAVGIAGTGWFQNLSTRLGGERAGLKMGNCVVTGFDGSAYAIGVATLVVTYKWTGGAGTTGTLGVIGDGTPATRGIGLYYIANGANTNLSALTGAGVQAVLITNVNLLSAINGVHAVAISPIAGNNWKFSYDGAAVATVAMGTTYNNPNTTDQVGFGSRSGGDSPMLGEAIDMMLWNSQVSDANMALLTTLPANLTYLLPESASTGAATIRIQASRYDVSLPTILSARGIGAPLTVSGVTKVEY